MPPDTGLGSVAFTLGMTKVRLVLMRSEQDVPFLEMKKELHLPLIDHAFCSFVVFGAVTCFSRISNEYRNKQYTYLFCRLEEALILH